MTEETTTRSLGVLSVRVRRVGLEESLYTLQLVRRAVFAVGSLVLVTFIALGLLIAVGGSNWQKPTFADLGLLGGCLLATIWRSYRWEKLNTEVTDLVNRKLAVIDSRLEQRIDLRRGAQQNITVLAGDDSPTRCTVTVTGDDITVGTATEG